MGQMSGLRRTYAIAVVMGKYNLKWNAMLKDNIIKLEEDGFYMLTMGGCSLGGSKNTQK